MRDADHYTARRVERDRAYTYIRHEDAVALRHAAAEARKESEEMVGAA